MHVYIYDHFVNKSKFQKTIAQIETRLTDLGLNGKIIRLNPTQNPNTLVENELRLGAKTIIAVGDNRTVNKVLNPIINHAINHNLNAALGLLPIGEDNNSLAHDLGIKDEAMACDVLSARRLEMLDVGQAKSLASEGTTKYFLASLNLPSEEAIIELNKKIKIELNNPGEIKVLNISNIPLPQSQKSTPQDGHLELYIRTNISKKILKKEFSQSFFNFKTLTLMSPRYKAVVDDCEELTTPIEVSILKKIVQVVVGKDRNF